MELLLKNSRIIQDVVGNQVDFPKYTTQIMNLANQNAQGIRPKVVGQMSELIEECPKGTYEEWVKWYSNRMPKAVDDAAERVYEMVRNIASAITVIDKALVRKWVEDLILTKTYAGFLFSGEHLARMLVPKLVCEVADSEFGKRVANGLKL